MSDATRPHGFPPELVDALEAVPYAPRPAWRDPRRVYKIAKGAVDFVAHNIPPWSEWLVRVNPYPKPWQRVRVPVDADGTRLGGWFAEGRPGAPALLYAPGTFQTKDDTPRKAKAIGLWRDLGYHVLVVDMRGFGDSHAVWGTGGYVEAHDLHAAARWLRARVGTRRVALMGDSLGGASALIAAAVPGASDLFSSVICWSPFADLRAQSAYATRRPRARDPFFVPYWGYRFLVWWRTDKQARDFNDFLSLRAGMLDLTPDDLIERSSPVTHVARVEVPTLVHHAEDDPIVPVEQARTLAAAAAANPLVRVRILPVGGHALFEAADPEWFRRTVSTLVSASRGEAPPSPPPAAAAHHAEVGEA